MFSRSLHLARIHGIEVRLSVTLPLFALLVLWAFGARFATQHALGTAIAMSVGGTVLLFASILAHELGHAIEARHRDLEVVGITLTMLGGATEMHAQDQSARDELAVAAIGPYVSLFCTAVFGLVATYAGDLLPATAAVPVGEVAGLLGWINVALAAFNLVPGAPLDGGRVLRAALWWILRDRQRGLVIAGRCGQVLWVSVIAASVWAFQARPELRLTALLVGMVGVVLFDAARREIANARLEVLYSDRTVGGLVGRFPATIPGDRSLELVEGQVTDGSAASRLAIVTSERGAIGLLDLGEVEALHATDRSVRTAADLARPLDDLPSVDVDEDLHTLVDRFQGEPSVVVVVRDGQPIGAVTEREAARALGRLKAGGLDEVTFDAPEGPRTAAGS